MNKEAGILDTCYTYISDAVIIYVGSTQGQSQKKMD